VDLVGVTTVYGNQTLAKTTANAIRILDLAGRGDVSVAAGAGQPLVRDLFVASYVHGETGLDGPNLPPPRRAPLGEHAVDVLAARLGAGTLVATGPLTNVALLLARHPDVRPERVVLMGGSIGEGNVTPAAEFNVWADPEAARRVFASDLDVTMVGLDVTHKAIVGPDRVERFRASGRVGRVVAELIDFYSQFHRQTYPELGGSPMHDPVALAAVIRPELLRVEPAHVEVDCSWGAGRGRTNVDLRGRGDATPNAQVAVDIDADGFLELLVERIASLA
jgi:inosine-uridine nucleoside N-ribohydrolase